MAIQAKSLIVAVLLIVGVGFGAYIFWGDKQSTTPREGFLEMPEFEERNIFDEKTQEEEPVAGETIPEEEITNRVIAVVGSEYTFSENKIKVSSGEEIVIEFINLGTVPHNFVVDMGDGSLAQTPSINPGETASIVIGSIPADITKLVFYCSIDDHRQLGMEGEFIIE